MKIKFDLLFLDYNSKVSNVRGSVDTAKEAVSLDVTDGRSWCKLKLFLVSAAVKLSKKDILIKSLSNIHDGNLQENS